MWRNHTNIHQVFRLVHPVYGMDTYIFKLNVFTETEQKGVVTVRCVRYYSQNRLNMNSMPFYFPRSAYVMRGLPIRYQPQPCLLHNSDALPPPAPPPEEEYSGWGRRRLRELDAVNGVEGVNSLYAAGVNGRSLRGEDADSSSGDRDGGIIPDGAVALRAAHVAVQPDIGRIELEVRIKPEM